MLERRAGAHKILEAKNAFAFALEARNLALERREVERIIDRNNHAFRRCRLHKEVGRIVLHGLNNSIDAALRRQYDDRQFLAKRFGALEGFHTAKSWHAEIEHHEPHILALLALEQRKGAFAAVRLQHGVSRFFADCAHQSALRRIVVNN